MELLGVGIERLAAVVGIDQKIAQHVNDDEEHQENTRHRHDDLLPDGGLRKARRGHADPSNKKGEG